MKGLRGSVTAVVVCAVFWLWGRGLAHPPAPHLPIGVHVSVPSPSAHPSGRPTAHSKGKHS